MSLEAWRGALLAARLSTCAVVSCLVCSPTAQAQGEGPRAYELAAEGSQALNIYGVFAHGDASFDPGSVVPGVEVDIHGSIIEYSHGFALKGNAGSVIVSLPVGAARRSVNVGGTVQSDSRSGIGDLQLTGAVGLVGSPAWREKEYEDYRPRFALSMLSRVYAPTGAYDRTAPVNLGQNRWALQLGLPFAYYLGQSFLDPALTSFELLPSVTWYGDNNEPSRGNHSSQAPLLQLEAHVTRNLNRSLWASLDGLVMEGGATTTDGISGHNQQRSFELGATVGVAVSDAVSATLSYTDAVSRNYSGVSGHVIRVVAEFYF
jgi:hypothetical protein